MTAYSYLLCFTLTYKWQHVANAFLTQMSKKENCNKCVSKMSLQPASQILQWVTKSSGILITITENWCTNIKVINWSLFSLIYILKMILPLVLISAVTKVLTLVVGLVGKAALLLSLSLPCSYLLKNITFLAPRLSVWPCKLLKSFASLYFEVLWAYSEVHFFDSVTQFVGGIASFMNVGPWYYWLVI